MLKKILNSQTNNFTFAALIVSGSTIFSAILGLLRDRLLAGTFGAGETLDVYFAAFRIPDLLQNVLAVGGLSAAFLPIFAAEMKKGSKEAFKFANNLLNAFFLFLLILCFIFFILCPGLVKAIVPGFSAEMINQTIVLTRIMLLTPILFTLSYIFSGILQYFDRFLAYSLAPVLYNLGIILGIFFFVPNLGAAGLAWGVVFGAFLFLMIQFIAAKAAGYQYFRILTMKNFRLKKAIKIMIPSSIGSGFSQLNLIVITALVSGLTFGSLTIFTFARNIQGLPVGIIGVPFAVAVFPILSKAWGSGSREKFFQAFSLVLRQVLFLTIPVSILMFLLRAQVVRIILGAGVWGWEETRITAASLGVFSFSIFSYSIIPIFQKGFYSIQDTKTPTLLSALTVFLNIVLSIIFLALLNSSNILSQTASSFLKLQSIENIQVIAFPLALTVSGIIQSFLLFLILIKKIGYTDIKTIIISIRNILILCVFMTAGVRMALSPLADIFPLTTFWGVLIQAGGAGLVGALIYIVLADLLRFPEFEGLKNSLLQRKR